jgi:isoaspartyl peptidase/L-asparaginase-like protein (Ntn-hydrolase superfamily)
MQVIVHGGAGSAPDDPDGRRDVLDAAAADADEANRPLTAVVRALRPLESDPRFNAGRGGAVQSDGRVRTDAGVMTGTGTTGAAAAMAGVEHAVEVARAVATETPHVCLAGERAVGFADAVGVDTRELLTDETRARYERADPPGGDVAAHLPWVRDRFGADDDASDGAAGQGDPRDHDTVGAVAVDGERVAAATSTAGRWFALAGRVGDVPQVGAGFFAGPAGGASATGAGEAIARDGLARRAVALLSESDAETAAERAIEEFAAAQSGAAGVIVAGTDGTLGAATNAEAMQTVRR